MMERPVRTLLTVAGVSLGVSAFIAVRTANIEVLRSFEQSVTAVSGAATLEIAGDETGLDESLITGVRRVPDVQAADPVLVVEGRLVACERPASLGADLEEAVKRLLAPGARKLPAPLRPTPGKGREFIRADALTRRFGDFTAVDRVSFGVRSGDQAPLQGVLESRTLRRWGCRRARVVATCTKGDVRLK